MNNGCHLQRDELLELLICNVEHARHVENERLSFNSIYIAVVAGFFALAFDFERPVLTIFFIGILLVISVVGLLFTKRWTDVFEEHSAKAQYIARLIYGDEELDPEDKAVHEEPVNKYYHFNHSYKRHTVRDQMEKAAKENRVITYEQAEEELGHFKCLTHKLCNIRTRRLFYFFYGIVISVLVIFFCYSIYQAVCQ